MYQRIIVVMKYQFIVKLCIMYAEYCGTSRIELISNERMDYYRADISNVDLANKIIARINSTFV